jgi:hypothetical protein
VTARIHWQLWNAAGPTVYEVTDDFSLADLFRAYYRDPESYTIVATIYVGSHHERFKVEPWPYRSELAEGLGDTYHSLESLFSPSERDA